MKRIIDRSFLLVFSFLFFIHLEEETLFVISLLIALIYSFGEELVHTDRIARIFCWSFVPAVLGFPFLLYFYPLASYTSFRRKQYPAVFICILAGFHYFVQMKAYPPHFFILLLGIGFSAYLCFNTERFTNLNKTFIHTVDSDREQQLELSKRNHILLENQDYKIYAATLQERNRIAREIHDNVGHLLSRSILLVGAMKTINKSDALKVPLDHLDESLNSAMTSIRTSVHDLHDESVNLSDAIHDLLDSFEFCPVELKYDMGKDIPKEVKYAFITITKEALTNISKHSNATDVSILMREQPVLYQLRIQDNGQNASVNDNGIGLSNMKKRISLLHGNIQITTEDGFQIFITVPKESC